MSSKEKLLYGAILKDGLIILLLCLIFFGGIFIFGFQFYVEKQIKGEEQIMTINFTNYIDKILEEPQQTIKQIKFFVDTKGDNLTLLSDILTNIRDENSFFYDIGLLDENGIVVAVSRNEYNSLGDDQSKSFAFLNAKNTNELVWSNIFTFYFSGEPTLTLSYKFDKYTVVGYINFDKISSLVYDFQKYLGQNNNYVITDSNGIFIHNSDENLVFQRRYYNDFELIKNIYEGKIVSSVNYIDGKKSILNVSKPKNVNWFVIKIEDFSLITDRILIFSIYLVSIMILLILLVLFFILRRIKVFTASINKVNVKAAEIANGDYSSKLSLQKYTELNNMIINFNEMLESIKKRDNKLNLLITRDSLTGILNRYGLECRVDDILSKNLYEKFAFIYFDIDNFKKINDNFGHKTGDIVLQNVANIILEQKEKNVTFSRIGGDEFIIVYPNMDNNTIQAFLVPLMEKFKSPIVCDNINICVSLSIGVSFYPHHASDFNQLLQLADIALYSSKNNGKNMFSFFNNVMLQKIQRDYQIEQDLKYAVSNGELFLMFQPQINRNGSIRGFEALVRWNNKNFGLVFPDSFLQIAEDTKEIIKIGRFVFENACDFIKKINGLFNENFVVAVNFSVTEMTSNDFFEMLFKTILQKNIDPRWIEIEITEKIAFELYSENQLLLKKISDFGISIAIDDFGTGFSSLSSLVSIPVNTLKLDSSFISDIIENEKKKKMVYSIFEMAKILNLSVIVEGINKEQQVVFLNNLDCKTIQGYYYSEPLLIEDAIKFIEEYK